MSAAPSLPRAVALAAASVSSSFSSSSSSSQPPSIPITNDAKTMLVFPAGVPVPLPDDLMCPISYGLMREPVILCDGQTYSKDQIKTWLEDGNNTSPLTNKNLENQRLTPNLFAQKAVTRFIESLIPLKDFVKAASTGDMKTLTECRFVTSVHLDDGKALLESSKAGQMAAVSWLMKSGADAVSISDPYGYTALDYAILYDKLEIVELLLSKTSKGNLSALVEKRCKHRLSPLHRVTGNPLIVKALIAYGAKIDVNLSGRADQPSVLHTDALGHASLNLGQKFVQSGPVRHALLVAGARWMALDPIGVPAVWSVLSGNGPDGLSVLSSVTPVEWLLMVNHRQNDGSDLLMYLLSEDQLETAESIITRYSWFHRHAVNYVGDDGENLLHYLVRARPSRNPIDIKWTNDTARLRLLKVIGSACSDKKQLVSALNCVAEMTNNMTPLATLLSGSEAVSVEMVEFFLQHGADWDIGGTTSKSARSQLRGRDDGFELLFLLYENEKNKTEQAEATAVTQAKAVIQVKATEAKRTEAKAKSTEAKAKSSSSSSSSSSTEEEEEPNARKNKKRKTRSSASGGSGAAASAAVQMRVFDLADEEE